MVAISLTLIRIVEGRHSMKYRERGSGPSLKVHLGSSELLSERSKLFGLLTNALPLSFLPLFISFYGRNLFTDSLVLLML